MIRAGNPLFLLAIHLNLAMRQFGIRSLMALGPHAFHCAAMIMFTGECMPTRGSILGRPENPDFHPDMIRLVVNALESAVRVHGTQVAQVFAEATQYSPEGSLFLRPNGSAQVLSHIEECSRLARILTPEEKHWTKATGQIVGWSWFKLPEMELDAEVIQACWFVDINTIVCSAMRSE